MRKALKDLSACLELQELHDIQFIAFILMPESVFKKCKYIYGFDDADC